MRIQTKGKTSLAKVNKIVKEVVSDITTKANIDPEVKYKIENFTCDIVFMVDGEEQKITVNHNGLPEIFTVGVNLDAKGNLDKTVDNSERSFTDPYVIQELTGEAHVFEVIESMYNDEDLEYLETNEVDDVQEIIYNLKDTNNLVVRYFKNLELVGELELEK